MGKQEVMKKISGRFKFSSQGIDSMQEEKPSIIIKPINWLANFLNRENFPCNLRSLI